MNTYGDLAMQMVRDHDPDRWAAIAPNSRGSYFAELGDRIQDQVLDLASQLAGPDVTGEVYLGNVGRLNAAKVQAEEIVPKGEIYDQLPDHEDEDLPIAETVAILNELTMARSWRTDDE